jgi:hypothetical protein
MTDSVDLTDVSKLQLAAENARLRQRAEKAELEVASRDNWALDVCQWHGLKREGDDDLFATVAKHVNAEAERYADVHGQLIASRRSIEGLRTRMVEAEAECDRLQARLDTADGPASQRGALEYVRSAREYLDTIRDEALDPNRPPA